MFEATQPVAGDPLDLLGFGLIELLRLQREIQRGLASEFMATRDSTDLLRPTLLMAMAFAFGAVHAATPGHGKAIVVSSFLGQGGVARRGVARRDRLKPGSPARAPRSTAADRCHPMRR